MEDKAEIRLTIDGKEVSAPAGATILEAARLSGIPIPTLCHHPALSNWGGCRMCVVEVDGAPKLAASCVMPVRPGMNVVTSNERILESRRIVLEFLFAERNHNCMFCPQSGDCELQKLAYEMKMDHLSMSFAFNRFPVDVTSETMVMDHNRCILCGRCVRACAELAGNYVLDYQNRGPRSLIGLDLNETRKGSSCHECGICLQVCPTGAIAGRYRTHYGVKGHPRDWKEVESLCPDCGLLCPTLALVSGNTLLRVDGRLSVRNGRPDRGQLCYRGRFEILKEGKRLLSPRVRGDAGWVDVGWEKALGRVTEGLGGLRKRLGGESLFAIASDGLSIEEFLLFGLVSEKTLGVGFRDTLDGAHFRRVLGGVEKWEKGMREASWKHIPEADFVLVVGGNPYRSQPLMASLLRRSMLEKGLKVALAGGGDCLMPHMAFELPVEGGKEAPFMEAFLAAAISGAGDLPEDLRARVSRDGNKGKGDQTLKAAWLGEEGREVFNQVVSAFLNSKNPLLIVGQDLPGEGASEVVDHALRIGMLKDALPDRSSRVVFLKTGGNSAAAWRLGIPSREEPKKTRAWKGGLLVLGSEKDASRVDWGALEGLEFLAVVTPFFGDEVARRAHVVIPSPARPETEGSFSSLDGLETGYKKRIVNPPEGVKELWETLFALAETGGSPLGIRTWDELRAEPAERAFPPAHQG